MAETTYRGRRSVSIENNDLRVTVLRSGGHIAEITDLASGINPLWSPKWRSIDPSAFDPARDSEYGSGDDARLLAGLAGHNLCLDLFGGPSAEEFQAGMTPHGEGSVIDFDIALQDGELVQRAELPLSHIRFERRIRLNGRVVRFRETVDSLAAFDRPIAWTQHVTLGEPFLERGATQFRASATKSKVFEGQFGSDDYLRAGGEFTWPMAPGIDGAAVNMQVFTSRPKSGAFTTHLMDPQRADSFFAAFSPRLSLLFGYVWKRRDFPWLGIWEENHSRTLSFFVPGGAAKGGWTSYTPLAIITDSGEGHHILLNGQTLWLIGFIFLITSSLLGAINFIATIIQLRAKGMTWMRLPFFVWAQFVTAFLLVLAFPPLEAAIVMQLMDRMASTSFFMPSGMVVNGAAVHISGGGSPLLWQHLFWFLGHPEVYVLILPGMGIVAEIIANNSRKPLWGYKSLVFSVLVLGFLSFIVWAHHMWLTGMGSTVSAFFQTTTLIISIPSVIILSAFFISLWGGSIRFNVPMLFATAFLPMFGIGGLTGIPLAFNSADLYLHDTYYVIAHFHYIVAPGTIFALFAGVYFWYPKATGRMMNEFWGKVHFWPSLICMNMIFLPMFLQGMLGMHRRWYDGGQNWNVAAEKVWGLSGFQWNTPISIAAWVMGLAQIPFIINFFWSIKHGKKVNDNPWEATTLEWTAPSPPPHGNFATTPTAHRGPYEYSLPGRETDFTMQDEPMRESDRKAYEAAAAVH